MYVVVWIVSDDRRCVLFFSKKKKRDGRCCQLIDWLPTSDVKMFSRFPCALAVRTRDDSAVRTKKKRTPNSQWFTSCDPVKMMTTPHPLPRFGEIEIEIKIVTVTTCEWWSPAISISISMIRSSGRDDPRVVAPSGWRAIVMERGGLLLISISREIDDAHKRPFIGGRLTHFYLGCWQPINDL